MLQYPPESSRHEGLSFSACPDWGFECPTVIDGKLILRASVALDMIEGISPDLPCRSIIRLVRHKTFTFRIYFAESSGKKYYLSLDEFYPAGSGVFLESETGPRMLLDLSQAVEDRSAASSIEVTIDCRADSISLTLGTERFEVEAPQSIHRALLVIDQLPSSRLASLEGPSSLVDRVAVKELREDGTFEMIAEGDFQNVPVFFNLSSHSGLRQDSKTYLFLAFLLLAVAAFLFDRLLAVIASSGVLAPLRLSGLLFALLPLQGVILFALRAFLALPFVSVLFCICMVAIVKFFLLLRHGLADSLIQASRRERLIEFGLLGVGMTAYGAAAVEIWVELTGNYHLSPVLTTLFVFIPPLTIVGGLLSERARPGFLWLACMAQFFSFSLLQRFYPIQQKTPFLIIAMIPFIVTTCVHVIKNSRGRAIVLQAYLAILLIAALGYTEILIRGVPMLNSRLSLQRSLWEMWSGPEAIPTLFKNRAQKDEFCFAGRVHTKKKPPDVFRILCLGSSSTAGVLPGKGKYSYPAQLDRLLAESSNQKLEVINGGISGVPFFMLEVHLKEVFLPLDPDLVIIYFGHNDDNLESRLIYDRMKREIAEAPFIESAEELWAAMHLKWNSPWMIQKFLGFARLRTFMAVVLASEQLRGMVMMEGGGEGVPLDESYKIESVEECVDTCVKQGRSVLLIPEVLLPDAHKGDGVVTHAYGNIFERVAEKYASRNVYYKNVLESFSPDIADSYLVDFVHMNDEGYRFLAEQIAAFLLEENIVAKKQMGRPVVPWWIE